jgi:hypothetical protein
MPAPRTNRPKSPFSRRLGLYMVGVAIGLFLVGFLLTVRRAFFQPSQSQPPPASTER